MRSRRDPLRSPHLREIDLHRLADHLECLACAFARATGSLAKSVPDDRGIAIDLLAPRADVTQFLDDDLGQQLLVVDPADLPGAAFVIDASDARIVGKAFVEL